MGAVGGERKAKRASKRAGLSSSDEEEIDGHVLCVLLPTLYRAFLTPDHPNWNYCIGVSADKWNIMQSSIATSS